MSLFHEWIIEGISYGTAINPARPVGWQYTPSYVFICQGCGVAWLRVKTIAAGKPAFWQAFAARCPSCPARYDAGGVIPPHFNRQLPRPLAVLHYEVIAEAAAVERHFGLAGDHRHLHMLCVADNQLMLI